jgi:hypothetical protein
MERMGHGTTRAALIYLHGADERQRMLAASVSERARAVLDAGRPDGRSSTDLARAGDANSRRTCSRIALHELLGSAPLCRSGSCRVRTCCYSV